MQKIIQKIIRIVVNIGLGAFLIYSLILVILYFSMIWAKIMTPEVKNMNGQESILFGLLAVLLLGLDFVIARYLIKQLNRTNDR
jgi:hypothetical protein